MMTFSLKLKTNKQKKTDIFLLTIKDCKNGGIFRLNYKQTNKNCNNFRLSIKSDNYCDIFS